MSRPGAATSELCAPRPCAWAEGGRTLTCGCWLTAAWRRDLTPKALADDAETAGTTAAHAGLADAASEVCAVAAGNKGNWPACPCDAEEVLPSEAAALSSGKHGVMALGETPWPAACTGEGARS